MEALGKYILSVTAAAILFGILQSLIGKKHGSAVLVKLIGGLFLAFTAIAPITEVRIDHLLDSSWSYTAQGNAIATNGLAISQDQLRSIIKEKSEAYILDKALFYNAQLEVDVTLSQDAMPIPTSVRLQGSISPYTRNAIQQWLQDEMGIPKENQVWIG